MSVDQEKTGEGRNTLPVKGNNIPDEAGVSVGNPAAPGFDNLPAAQQPAICGQQQYEGQQPIIALAARVSPATGEV